MDYHHYLKICIHTQNLGHKEKKILCKLFTSSYTKAASILCVNFLCVRGEQTLWMVFCVGRRADSALPLTWQQESRKEDGGRRGVKVIKSSGRAVCNTFISHRRNSWITGMQLGVLIAFIKFALIKFNWIFFFFNFNLYCGFYFFFFYKSLRLLVYIFVFKGFKVKKKDNWKKLLKSHCYKGFFSTF